MPAIPNVFTFAIIGTGGLAGPIARQLSDIESASSTATGRGLPHYVIGRTELRSKAGKRHFRVEMLSAHGCDGADFAKAVEAINLQHSDMLLIIKKD